MRLVLIRLIAFGLDWIVLFLVLVLPQAIVGWSGSAGRSFRSVVAGWGWRSAGRRSSSCRGS